MQSCILFLIHLILALRVEIRRIRLTAAVDRLAG
jgi:hypothetical protein